MLTPPPELLKSREDSRRARVRREIQAETGPAIGAPTDMDQFDWDMKWARYHELAKKAQGYGWQGMTTEEFEEYEAIATQYAYETRSRDQRRRHLGVAAQIFENLGTPFTGLGNLEEIIFPFGGMTTKRAAMGPSVPEVPEATAWGHPIETIPKVGTLDPWARSTPTTSARADSWLCSPKCNCRH